MASAETIHQAIQALYQAALSPQAWPAALAAIMATVDAHRGFIVGSPVRPTNLVVSCGLSPEQAQRFQLEFETRLPDWIRAIPVGSVLRQSSMISDKEFRRSDLYNEVVHPVGAFYGVIAPLVRTPQHQVHLTIGRDLGAPDFTDESVGALRPIVPHFLTALHVRSRLGDSDLRARWIYESLTQLSIGVILLDAWMHPLFVNSYAEAIAAEADGLLLHAQSVSASNESEARVLDEAVARAIAFNTISRDASESAARQPALRCRLSRTPPRQPLFITIVPVHESIILEGVHLGTRAILFVVAPEMESGSRLANPTALFQLTEREKQLATLLSAGLGLSEAASELGIGVGTARGYLKQVMSKTGTHRQAELVSLLLRGGFDTACDPKRNSVKCVASVKRIKID